MDDIKKRRIISDISAKIKHDGFCIVSNEVARELWQEPELNPVLDLALAMNDNRPRSTKKQLMALFAGESNCEYRRDVLTGNFVFTKK